jgi:type I restriction enzyme, S subunit
MSFPRYSKYKYSGVEWLEDVPEHWEIKKVSHIADLIAGFAFSSEKFEFNREAGIPLVRGDNVTEGWLRWEEKGRYWPFNLEYDPRYLLEANDIVIQMDGSKVGKNWAFVTQDDLPLLLVQRVTRVRVTGALPRYVYALIANELFVRYVDRAKTDPAIPHITMRNIGDYWLPLPPCSEQSAIAAFLDRETGKIDALMAEQRRLIELLKEKRQAVISHAVTKGLNPHAPLKPSGIEWLGDVPEHWEVSKMKWVAKMESGHTPDKKIAAYWENCDIPWVSLNDTVYLKDNDYISDTAYRVNELGIKNSSARLLPARVVVFSRDATIGRCAITTRPMAVSQHFIAWVCGKSIIPEFLLLRLRSMTQELDHLTTGATLKTIGMPDVRTLITPVPPVAEQHTIVQHVSELTSKLDCLVAVAERAIDLLQERRTALISAAVTGKIDVRAFAQTEAA